MADSSFDPLGMVKAMGPQRDPYSWAELYATDAAKAQMARDEFKNRLLIQEMTRAERAKEGAADRASREGMAREAEAGRNKRFDIREKYGWGGSKGADRDYFMPPHTLDPKTFRSESALRRVNKDDYRIVKVGKDTWHVRNDQLGAIKIPGAKVLPPGAVVPTDESHPTPAAPAAPPRSRYEEDIE